MQVAPPPPPRSPTHSALSVLLWAPTTPDSPATARPAGKGAAGQGKKGAVAVGTGKAGAGGRQVKMRVRTAAVEAAGAGRRGAQRGEPEVTGPRADLFNPATSDRPSASMVADILEVSEEEGEGAGRTLVAKGHRQRTEPNE